MIENIELLHGDKFRENRFVYQFLHFSRTVIFGPYEDQEEAKTAFQKRYGYWPGDAIEVIPYVNDPRERR